MFFLFDLPSITIFVLLLQLPLFRNSDPGPQNEPPPLPPVRCAPSFLSREEFSSSSYILPSSTRVESLARGYWYLLLISLNHFGRIMISLGWDWN